MGRHMFRGLGAACMLVELKFCDIPQEINSRFVCSCLNNFRTADKGVCWEWCRAELWHE